MSNFISNIVRRGAGFTPMTIVQSRAMLPFASQPVEPHTAELERAMPAGEPTPDIPTDSTAVSSQLRQAATLSPAAPLPGTPLPASVSPVDAPFQPSQMIDSFASQQLPAFHDVRMPAVPAVIEQRSSAPELEHQSIQSQTLPSSGGVAGQPHTLPDASAKGAMGAPALPATDAVPPLIKPTRVEPSKLSVSTEPARRYSEPPPIHVRIGTIEIRATTPPAPAPPTKSTTQGFDDYTLVRNYRTWGQD